MVPPDATNVALGPRISPSQIVNETFGALRAEYLGAEMYRLFSHPAYFPQLLSPKPCILVGGRGTGKTTALKSLSFPGQHHLHPDLDWESWDFFGMYWRIDTSVVTAFRGSEADDTRWIRLFSHYVNLTLVQLLCEFDAWLVSQEDTPLAVEVRSLARACKSLGVPPATSLCELREFVEDELVELEVALNNIDTQDGITTSVLGRPMQLVVEGLQSDRRVAGKYFYFLIDEFETLNAPQQRVINTLIKHTGDHLYTFKIGVRELGHKDRSTLNEHEHLSATADYEYIDISQRLTESDFSSFARSVCEHRLALVRQQTPALSSMEELLPPLSVEAEASKLGATDEVAEIRERLVDQKATDVDLANFDALSLMSAAMVGYWATSIGASELEVLRDAISYSDRWSNRLNNYKHSMLFTLATGNPRRIRKYYCGWNTLVMLADGNIRFVLQLVHEALQQQLRGGESAGALERPLSPEVQTRACSIVGERAVEQLQGVSKEGPELTRLVLSLGRVFEVMAAQPHGRMPEVSQFRVTDGDSVVVEQLLSSAVMHLVVRRFPTNKRAGVSGQVKDFSYQLHPIFAPFFVYSHRSKRRINLSSKELLALVSTPTNAIPALLKRNKRDPDVELPEQLSLFRGFFSVPD